MRTKENLIARSNFALDRYIRSLHPGLYIPFGRYDWQGSGKFRSSDGIGRVCTVTGATKKQYSASFDGFDDKVSVTYGVDTTPNWWVGCWLKTLTLPTVAGEGIWQLDGTHMLYWAGVNNLRCYWGTNIATVTFTQQIGQWIFAGMGRSGSNWVLDFNGETSKATGTSANTSAATTFDIGLGNGVYWNFEASVFMAFPRLPSAIERIEIYQKTKYLLGV